MLVFLEKIKISTDYIQAGGHFVDGSVTVNNFVSFSPALL
jgi:hypothetical protein